jgi:hypothetical protein
MSTVEVLIVQHVNKQLVEVMDKVSELQGKYNISSKVYQKRLAHIQTLLFDMLEHDDSDADTICNDSERSSDDEEPTESDDDFIDDEEREIHCHFVYV